MSPAREDATDRDDASRGEPFAAAFREACARGVLELAPCAACGQLPFPPGPACRHCGGELGAPVELPGEGTVVAVTVNHRAPDADFAGGQPYAIVLVDIDPPPRMAARGTRPVRLLCNLVDPRTGALRAEAAIGQRVRVTFARRRGVVLLQVTEAQAGQRS
ncbi:MAG: hypothetical protein DWQ36_00535 [Acidobacteria bacterium]|nr:MAG: hypothetical protein DWQ30_18690 [Acidobacteriota bacterium]REK12181.1 MAG: hypothetical protein DWQ36_00535 [Acidobacteriota bacterium]